MQSRPSSRPSSYSTKPTTTTKTCEIVETHWSDKLPFALFFILLLFWMLQTFKTPGQPSFFDRRKQALLLLTLQNASVSLLTRFSILNANYSPSVAVLSTELVKAGISAGMLARERRRGEGKGKGSLFSHAVSGVGEVVRDQKEAMSQLAVPAGLYSLQNTLLYTALSNLTAEVYQTTYQLKLLTTAIFSILFFRTPVSRSKWISLFLLTLGVAIVQLEPSSFSSSSSSSTTKHDTLHDHHQDPKKGFFAIFLACISSGLAGAWFEKVLKATPSTSPTPSESTKLSPTTRSTSPSLWTRNLQLSFPSLLFALLGVYLSNDTPPFTSSQPYLPQLASLWSGFTPIVWFVVLNQALGGLLVALVVREASSIDKGFATSIAIVISTLFSSVMMGTLPSTYFVGGAGLVISSTVLYSLACI